MEPIKECLDILVKGCVEIEAGDPRFRDSRIKVHPLDAKNIHEIKMKDSERTISFVDGGNSPILTGPNFTVELTRVYFNLFCGNKRKNAEKIPHKIEFFTVVTSKITQKNEIEYQGRIIPLNSDYLPYLPNEESLKLLGTDRSLMIGNFTAPASRVADAARRFAEWKYTEVVIQKELKAGDLIIRDGSLQTGITNESEFANGVYLAAFKKGVIFSGFAKTNRVLTTTGNSLAKVIKTLGDTVLPRKAWYYHPVADINIPDHKAELFYLNLHPLSPTAFRYEIFRDQASGMDEGTLNTIFSDLVKNARDPAFPGYPYGLLEADSFGRATSREADYYCTLLLSLADQREELVDLVSTISAHNIIDLSRKVG